MTDAVTSLEHFSFQPSTSAPPADAENDFEFRLPAAAAALSAADELFSGGKLVPLLPPLPPFPPPSPPPPEPSSPRAPRCAGRWRDLLLLVSKKPSAAAYKNRTAGTLKKQESHVATSSLDSGSNAHLPPPPSSRARATPVANLLLLVSKKPSGGRNRTDGPLKRHEPYSYPLLSRASSTSSTSSSSDSGRNARAPPKRFSATAAPESPRVSASGRVVFRGLERSASTPAAAAWRPRPRGMERSYSANVRVDPVISVFGFGHLFLAASPPARDRKAEKERDAAAAGRRSRPQKLAMVLRDPDF